jgi:hypothetical protein
MRTSQIALHMKFSLSRNEVAGLMRQRHVSFSAYDQPIQETRPRVRARKSLMHIVPERKVFRYHQ